MQPRNSGSLVVLVLLACTPYAFAQQAPDGLTDQQRLGRQVLAQSCGVCHLPPARGAKTYGPVLSKATSGGDDSFSDAGFSVPVPWSASARRRATAPR